MTKQTQTKPKIIIHGGAIFDINDETEYNPNKKQEYLQVLKKSAKKGKEVLDKNGKSEDAVCEAIIIMENSGLFDAGRGSVFAKNEIQEMDTSIMRGSDLAAGAMAGINKIKNPILGAKVVMEKCDHTLLIGEGAHDFAKEKGLEIVDPEYFFNQPMWEHFLKVKAEKEKAHDHGTVGAVALDSFGNISAGTSTGGTTYKMPGRVGDSPIIGSGTYADNNLGGISCTGSGDIFMRVVAAYSALIQAKNSDLGDSISSVLEKIKELDGMGGMIGIDKNGNLEMKYNSPGIFWAKAEKEILESFVEGV